MKNLLRLFVLLIICTIQVRSLRFYVIRQWKYINFTWPDEDSHRTATAKGLYIPENILIGGVKYFEGYFYLTLPRMRGGVPATLARIHAGPPQQPSPDLEPYPSWEMNKLDDCGKLQNVQNIEIDTKGRMWILDGGRTNTLADPVYKCPPKLVIFDIKSNKTMSVHNFPENVASPNGSFLFDIVVDDTDGGFAYITDNSAQDPGIIVFSAEEDRSWKFRSPHTMSADPSAIHFTVNGDTIATPINVAAIALGPKLRTSSDKIVVNEDREVYFCPISSLHLYSVNTTVLRNEQLLQNIDVNKDVKDIGLKASQSSSMTMDNRGILYYTLLGINAIGQWDSHTSFQSEQKLIAKDEVNIEWPSSLTFNDGNLTILMNRLNKFIFNRLDVGQYNFRIFTAHVGSGSYLQDDNFSYNSSETHPMTPTSTSMAPSTSHPEHENQTHVHGNQSAINGTTSTDSAGNSPVIIGFLTVTSIISLFVVR